MTNLLRNMLTWPWLWPSGQRAHLPLGQYEFKSCQIIQFYSENLYEKDQAWSSLVEEYGLLDQVNSQRWIDA